MGETAARASALSECPARRPQPLSWSWPHPHSPMAFPLFHIPRQTRGAGGGRDQAGACPQGHLSSLVLPVGNPLQQRLVRNSGGAVISVWLPEQAGSCDYTARFGAGFKKFSFRPVTFWCRRMFPVGAIILGWEFSLPTLNSVDMVEGLIQEL